MNLNNYTSIIYPKDFKVQIVKSDNSSCVKDYICVPHKALKYCQKELDSAFSSVEHVKADYVFVLAPLHKGKVFADDCFKIYSYSDCFVRHNLIEYNNDVCSEEFSYELLIPYIQSYFPNSRHTAFYAPEESKELIHFIFYLKKNYSNSIFIVSNNTSNCAQMWIQAFQALKSHQD